MLECVEDSLELLELVTNDLPLDISTSISIGTVVDRVIELFWILVVKRNNISANSLLSTTIQDGGIRERNMMIDMNHV